MAEDRLHLIEPTIVPDVWIDGIGRIDRIAADTYRLLLYRIRRPIEGGHDEHEVVLSIMASGPAATAALAFVNSFVMASAEIREVLSIIH